MSHLAQRAFLLAQQGDVSRALELLEQATIAGDGSAAATLAEWRLTGQFIRRDLILARDLFGRAAALGFDPAASYHIAMLANGAGGAGRRWAEALDQLRSRAHRDPLANRQLSLLDCMAIDANGDPLEAPRPIQVLSDNPLVETIGAFLTPEECSYLVDRATPMLQPSIVVHPVTGRAVRDPVRTALSASFPFVLEDPVVHAINRRITAATATRFEQGEPLQVLSYDVGQEYKLHSDTLPAGLNQRTQTFLVTLSAGFAGGATDFPRIPLRFRGQAGDALRFSNVDESGQPDARAWHAGLPVSRGRKLILSKWIRERPLDLSGAPGRSL